MKKVALLLLFSLLLFAQPQRLSPLPLPKTTFIDLSIYECNEECLEDLLQKGEVFTFLAKLDKKNIKKFSSVYTKLAMLFSLPAQDSFENIHIHIVSKKYLNSINRQIVQSTLAYVGLQNLDFTITLKELDTNQTIQEAIEQDALNIVVATFSDIDTMEQLDTNATLFIPTINKKFIQTSNRNIFFGGIDYEAQIEKLLRLKEGQVAIFYLKNSPLSQKLTDFAARYVGDARLYPIDTSVQNLKILKNNQEINESTIVLNTPIVKTSLILSQLTYYDLAPFMKLSTQINYSSDIFALTQPQDRKNLYMANSITDVPSQLDANNQLFEIQSHYNWISYAVQIGLDNFIASKFGKKKLFGESFVDNQIEYAIRLEEVLPFSFQVLAEPQENREESEPAFVPSDTLESNPY